MMRLKIVSKAASVTLVAVGLMVLTGWTFNLIRLTSIVAGYTPMNPFTAIFFVILSGSLWRQCDAVRSDLLARCVAAAVAVVAGFVFLDIVCGLNVGLDRSLFTEGLMRAANGPNRMAPNTALAFVFCGVALAMLDWETSTRRRPAQWCALGAGVLALLALIGYAYSAMSLARVALYIPMAIHSSLSFLMLSTGIICARPDKGIMRSLLADSIGSTLLRRLLPTAILLPIFLGWLMLLAQQSGIFTTVFAVSLLAILIVLVFSTLLWLTAARVHELDEKRKLEEQRRRMIIDNCYDVFVGIDGRGEVVEWNSQAEVVFGWTRAEACGKTLASLILPERFREAHRAGIVKFLATGEGPVLNKRLELSALRRSGVEFPVEFTISPIQIGSEWLFSAFMRDVSERKRAEAELAQARDEALQSAQMKSEFLANMSHEIRTPMNGIIGMSDLLFGTKLSPQQREFASTIQSSADALMTIIDDILDFSKIEAGKLEFELLDFDLRSVVEGVADLMTERAHAKGLELAYLIHRDVPTKLRGDPGRLRQVLLNLVSNAVKFTNAGEVVMRVTVESKSDARCTLRFSVTDTGIGLSDSAMSRLFQPFTQADGSTTRQYGGTGLGLAISKQLAIMMKGEIGAESQQGKGSTFWFTAVLERSAPSSEALPAVTGALNGTRALIVDDNETNRKILQYQLSSWQVPYESAGDGREALNALHRARTEHAEFTIALIDMQMPGMDGLELARAIKADPGLSGLRVLMMASQQTGALSDNAREAGVDAVLIKPVKPAKLLDCITSALTLQSQPQSARPASRPQITVHKRRGRILLAEDNPVNQRVASLQLERLGFGVDIANSGQEAIAAVSKFDYDLVLMDCQMPDIDGFQATAAIRNLEPKRNVTIVAMTANAMEGDRERCLSAGMNDYLSKPVEAQKLEEVLTRWLPNGTDHPESGLDLARLREASGGDDAALREIVAVYLESTEQELRRLGTAIETDNFPEMESIAHTCAGGSATCGVTPMVVAMKDLQRAALQKDAFAAQALQAKVRAEFARLKVLLEAVAADGMKT